ncbi:hypothetical protein HOY80DRAFT_1059900 [Tuber brumale]|nr:hypothetical protein HOY80DRAFT_1059900 [Tuber brumale]
MVSGRIAELEEQLNCRGQNTILGRICKLDTAGTNTATTNLSQSRDRNHRFLKGVEACMKWVMMAFGVGTVLLRIGANVLKIYHYDVIQTEHIRTYVQGEVGNLEKVKARKLREDYRIKV